MGQVTLSTEQAKGAKVAIIVVMLVLLLFVLILAAGHPIMDFGTEPPSVAYAIVIYLPVMALCVIAYRRLR